MKRSQKLYAAHNFHEPAYQWWVLPQVLNHYHCPVADYARWALVGQAPALLYLTLRATALNAHPKRLKELAAGRHYWHHMSWKRRHQPLDQATGQALLRVFGYTSDQLTLMLDRDKLMTDFYQDGDEVKAIKRGAFGYNELDYEGEQEMWTTVECGACGHEEHVREQMGDATPAQWLADNVGELAEFEHLSGPYARCEQCEAVSRLKVYPAEDMCEDAWANYNEDSSEQWEYYQEHLEELIGDLTRHLETHGLPKPAGLRLEVGHADWMGRDAWAECELEGKALAEKMRVNSDYTISNGRLLLSPSGYGELRCSLSHHDVPMGSPVTVMPYWECELDDRGDTHLDFEAVKDSMDDLGKLAAVLLAGPQTQFEYAPGSTFTVVDRENLAAGVEWLAAHCGLDELDELEGYNLALGMLLQRLADDIRGDTPIHLSRAERTRAVLDHWLEHSTEEECN